MATLKIESAAEGNLWVALTRFGNAGLAQMKQIPGHRWNPERKQWSFPDTPATRAALAGTGSLPSDSPPEMITVKPMQEIVSSKRMSQRYIPGRDQPLTTHPPHTCTCVTAGASVR
ncbi:MAG: hypothetical protein M1482_00070 [Chloroflexi bacterium]|nr:hypothetical protein [Chloroflexota bacterium]